MIIAFWNCFLCTSVMFGQIHSDREGVAVLEAAAHARENLNEVNLQVDVDTGNTAMQYIIKKKGDKWFFLVKTFSEGKLVEEKRSLVLGDIVYMYTDHEHEDVMLDSVDRVYDQVAGFGMLDPRTIGLNSGQFYWTKSTPREELALDPPRTVTVLDREQVNNNTVYRIRVPTTDGNGESVYQVNNNHQVLSADMVYENSLDLSIKNTFRKNEIIPETVAITILPGKKEEENYKIKVKQIGTALTESDFELAQLDLAHGTACSDYRINRIIGFWNGSEFVEDPDAIVQPPPADSNHMLNIAIVVSVLILVTLTIIYLKKQK